MTKISVIITTHDWSRYGDFRDALRSVEAQSYDDIEIVTPFDADSDMLDATEAVADGGVVSGFDPEADGLAAARNNGAELASGDVYAFLDDDCVASKQWIETLVDAIENGAIAAGGPANPVWPDSRPWYIPQGWDWLVGGGPYHVSPQEVRNTYGCNIAFRADVFDALDGFDERLGKADSLAQGEESELCQRMREEYGQGVQYRPNADVKHRVYPEQLAATHLLERAYAQGQTKRAIGVDDTETGFLQDVLGGLVRQAPHRSLAALAYTTATGGGFLRGPPADSPLLEVTS
jgi:GT2 family glycosyltransferase